MSNTKRRPEPEPQPAAENVPGGAPPSPLAEYRGAIDSLKTGAQHLADMREVEAHVRGEQARLEVDRERLLEAASAGDSEGDVDELTRLAVKSEVLTRKLKHLTDQIADAEQKAESEFVTVSASLTSLWNMFRFWFFGAEKERIAALMIAPVPQLALEQVVTCFKTVVAVRALEPTGGDVASLTKQADALFAAISAIAFQKLPDPVATTSVAAAQVSPQVDYNQPLAPLPTGVYTTSEPPDEGDVIYRTL